MRFPTAQQMQPDPQLQQEMQELLAQLKDIHEPASVGLWPPAPGWWLLGLLALVAVAALLYLLRRRRIRRARYRYRAEALELLRGIDPSARDSTAQINEILKRVAVVSFGRPACGNLTGQRWIDFLERYAPEQLPAEARAALLEHLYRQPDSAPGKPALLDHAIALRDYAMGWVQSHQHTPRNTEAAGV